MKVNLRDTVNDFLETFAAENLNNKIGVVIHSIIMNPQSPNLFRIVRYTDMDIESDYDSSEIVINLEVAYERDPTVRRFIHLNEFAELIIADTKEEVLKLFAEEVESRKNG